MLEQKKKIISFLKNLNNLNKSLKDNIHNEIFKIPTNPFKKKKLLHFIIIKRNT